MQRFEKINQLMKKPQQPLANKKSTDDFVKNLPHTKYIARPLYRLLGGDQNPLISVPLTFAFMDILMHQLAAAIAFDFYNDELSLDTFKKIDPIITLAWICFSVPNMLDKWLNLENNREKRTMRQASTLFTKFPNKKSRQDSVINISVLFAHSSDPHREISDEDMAVSVFGQQSNTAKLLRSNKKR